MTQHLTVRDVIRAAREAYHEGRLQAQVMTAEYCSYVDNEYNCVCAIGAALNKNSLAKVVAKNFNVDTSVATLASHGIVSFPDTVQAIAIMEIQDMHDRWAGRYLNEGGRPTTGEDFLAFLKVMERRYS